MPTKKARLQVILPDDATEHIKELADERGLSVSAMCCQLIHAALKQPEFRRPVKLSKVKAEAIKCAIEGGEIADFKIAKLLEIVSQMEGLESQ